MANAVFLDELNSRGMERTGQHMLSVNNFTAAAVVLIRLGLLLYMLALVATLIL